MDQKKRTKRDGLTDLLRILGASQAMCLEGISKIERTLKVLAWEMREGYQVLEDMIACQRGCELTALHVSRPRIARRSRKR